MTDDDFNLPRRTWRSRPHSLLAFLCSVFKVHPNDRTRPPEEDVGVDRSWPRDCKPSTTGWLNAIRLAIRTALTGHPSGLSMYRPPQVVSSELGTTAWGGGLVTIARTRGDRTLFPQPATM